MDTLTTDNLKAQKEKRSDTLIWVLRGLISVTFLFSGFSKIYPYIEAFEHDLVNKGIANWAVAHYLARALISFEFFIGFAYLQNHYFRKIIVPASFLLLAAFSVYLCYTLYLDGNTGNCGCFGQVLPMTPLEALIKNIVLMGMVAYIYFKTQINGPHWHIPMMVLEATGFFVLLFSPIPVQSVSQPFTPVSISANAAPNNAAPVASSDTLHKTAAIINKPAKQPTTNNQQPTIGNQQSTPNTSPQTPKTSNPAPTPSPFAKFTTFSDKKTTNLDDGVKLIALFDPDCDHCMRAATKIANLRKNGLALPPMYILFLEGNDDKIPNFFDVTGLHEPYMVVGAIDFFQFLKNSPPRIVLLNNGAIVGDWESEDFDEANFKATVEKNGK